MFHPVTVFISLRYSKGYSGSRFSRLVPYISVTGIVIGVMSLVIVLSVMNGFESQLKNRILGVLPQAVISYQDNKTSKTVTAPDFILAMSNIPAKPIVRSEVVVQSVSRFSGGHIVGIEANDYDPIEQYLILGSLSDLKANSYQIFIGETLARSLNVLLGDKVRLTVVGLRRYTPFGLMPSQRNFTVAGIFNTGSDVDTQLIMTHISDAGRLLRYPMDTISGWRLFFDDPFAVADLSTKPLPKGWCWSDWREQRGELFQAVRMEKNAMSLMLSSIIVVAVFNIISVLVMLVIEKQSEFAILKTQGVTCKQIFAIIIVRGLSLGVIGSIIGSFTGVMIANNLNVILGKIPVALLAFGDRFPVLINPIQIIGIIFLSVSLSLLATIFPAYKASSIKPAEILRYE
ncbi:lipoprotein-releasing system transmembrane protein [Candidatus Photodesmus blepharus]|uniref:Lipoprotein-releasing system transmembrane protein n=1 Tax=Candidatus Photodesmus blepharonis TaxID=1179155 RepID=A0A084CML5_9GAMM|nr:lipoprotein-releasing ABC transporter permease subunit [Candidatus Photodesmus blepharus]KEY91044.1 lipoprotein-releasing system transmembrane protein [Candidatus Photodesmus blepharus]